MDSLNSGPGTVNIEEDDELNNETFGDAEEWEWNGEGDGGTRASKDSVSRLMSSTIISSAPHHSSNIMRQLTGPNMSSILTCSDLESSLGTLKLEDPAIKSCTAIPPPRDNSMSGISVAEDSGPVNLDDFDFSDPNDSTSSSKIKSIYFDNVWAPPDTSILKPSIGGNPWNTSGSPVAPKDDPYKYPPVAYNKVPLSEYKPVPTGNVLRLEDIEAGMLNESSVTDPAKEVLLPQGQNHPPIPSVPVGKGKTLEEIERELLVGNQSEQSKTLVRTAAQGPATQPHTGSFTILQRPQVVPVHPMMHPVMIRPGMRPMFAAVAGHHVPRGVVPIIRPLHTGYMIPPSLYPMTLQRFEYHQGFRHPIFHHQLPPHPYLQQQMNLQRFQGPPLQQRYQRRERNEEVDEYAGLMSKKEQDWLVHIQKMQLDNLVSDPYVDDYYNMCYNSKKLNNKSTAALLILDRVNRGQSDNNKNNFTSTNRNVTSQIATAYSPFNTEGSLGKLQVSNAKCPRKLLDLVTLKESTVDAESEPAAPALARKELTQLRKLLLDIERLYLILMKIDYEDKRMAALPESSRGPHKESRRALCSQLFEGITVNKGKKLDHKIASIRKGAALILRALLILDNLNGKKLIAVSMVKEVENFPALLIHKDYLPLLLDSIEEIKKFDPVLALTLKSKIEGKDYYCWNVKIYFFTTLFFYLEK